MTVSTQTSSTRYTGDGTSTVFQVPFYVLENTHLDLESTDPTTDITVPLVLGTDYTVQNVGTPSGCQVTLVVPPAVGIILFIGRNVPIDQEVDYTPNDKFPAQTTETAFDKLTMICQQLAGALARAIHFPSYESTNGLISSVFSRASTLFGFDSSGNLTYYPITASIGAGDLKTDVLVNGVNYIAGTSSSVSLSRSPGSIENVVVHFMDSYQGKDNILSVVGNVLTFTSVIPLGIDKIYVTTGTTLSQGVIPEDAVGLANLTEEVLDHFLTADAFSGEGGAALVGFLPTGIGATATTVQEALNIFNQKPTNNWWSNHDGKINRINDRLFVGDACAADGNVPPTANDWLTNLQISTGRGNGFLEFAQMVVETSSNSNSGSAFLAGAKTSQMAGTGNGISITGLAFNDGTAHLTSAWAFYGEGYNMPGAQGSAYGMELDVCNFNVAAPITPYAQNGQQVVGLQLAAGAELAFGQTPSTAAINIANNHAVFDKGIVFGSDSINGATGSTGQGIAIALGQGHTLQWYTTGGGTTAQIVSLVTQANASAATALEFNDGGAVIRMFNGRTLAQFQANSAAGNYARISASVSGSAVQYGVEGADANVDLYLVPKGTGLVRFGTYTAGAGTPIGYMSVLDAGGTLRKVSIVS